MSTATPPTFRADIQILRGVAVLAVLVFHLFPSALPGGFLGVDVFFVVSGFLMAYLYGNMAGVAARRYWLKRARRILPAYFATIVATLLIGSFIILPHQLADTARAAMFSAALIPNIGYFLDTSYFDVSNFRPLLHLWSLGVEAQFYLVFPLFAWLWRKSPPLLLALALLAFLACLAPISRYGPFFLTPFRMWEFAIGFAAARWGVRLLGAKWIGSGALVVLLALFFVPVPENAHPGFAALTACVVTAAVLLGRLPAKLEDSRPGQALVTVGKYSYSMYLVHYPVIALVLYRPFYGNNFPTPSVAQFALILALIAVLSLALYHLIESPARKRAQNRFSLRMVGAALAILALGLAAPVAAGSLYTPTSRAIFAAWTDRAPYRCGKINRLANPLATTCQLSGGARRVLLVGDSHADAIKTAVVEAADANGMGVVLWVDNCALGRPGCEVPTVLAEAERLQVEKVIVHAAESNYEPAAVVELARSLRVVAISPTPAYQQSVPLGLFTGKFVRDQLATVEARHQPILSGLAALPSLGSKVLDPVPLYCTPDCALADEEGRPYYFDSNHLTLTGARLMIPTLSAAIGTDSPRSYRDQFMGVL